MQKAIIDLSKNGIIPVFHAKQGDTSRRVAITLLDNGLPYDTAADAVSVWYRGPSGEGNYSDGIDKDGSTLTILVNPNMTAASGRHTCAVMLSNESGRCTTWNFCVEVAYTPALGSEEAKAYFEAFEAGELAADIAAVDARTAKAVAELNARVSAIIASGTATEGNTELIDIRTGADGKVYQTAGDAVRGQIGELKGDLGKIKSDVSTGFVQYEEKELSWTKGGAFSYTKKIGGNFGTDATSNNKYSSIDVLPNEVYLFRGNATKACELYNPILFVDSNNKVVKLLFTDAGSIGTKIEETTVTVPNNATKMYINSMGINITYPVELKKVNTAPIKDTVLNHEVRIKKLEEVKTLCNIIISKTIYAIVGDTLQIYFDSIIDSQNKVIIKVSGGKGRTYNRYWEYTPTSSDIGTTTITFSAYDFDGNILENKEVSLITKNPTNSSKNILNIGDSLMMQGQIPIELSRRLKGTNGLATSPSHLNLSSFNVVGRMKNDDGSVGWEGTGGWTFSSYNGTGITSVRFYVSGVNNISVGDIIQIHATNSTGYYRFQIAEVNVTSGVGNIRCIFYNTPYNSNFLNETASNGDIKNTSNVVIYQYTSLSLESYQPFWDTESNSFNITNYVDAYCDGKVDYVYILLGTNSIFSKDVFDNFESIINDCKTLIRNIHTQLPNVVILLSTEIFQSQNSGLALSYGTNNTFGRYTRTGLNHMYLEYNKALINEFDNSNYPYVKVLNTHAQFDSKYAFPMSEKNVNTRCTQKEVIDTNGSHPSNVGYWQIADAEFRAILGI